MPDKDELEKKEAEETEPVPAEEKGAPDSDTLADTPAADTPAEGGAPAPDPVILSEAKDPTPQADAPQKEGDSSPEGLGMTDAGEAPDSDTPADAPAEGGAPSDEGAVEDGLPSETEGGNYTPDDADPDPDEDDEPIPKYVLPVFLGIIALIAALIVVLFFAPGLLRSKSPAGSESEVSFSSVPSESGASPSSSSPPSPYSSYSDIDEIPDFVLYGVTPYLMDEGEPYSYMTEDIDEEGTSLVGVITARSYKKGGLTKAAQAFAADMELDLTGYESRRVTFEITFDDGYPEMGYLCTDYYSAAEFESEFDMISSSPDGEYEYYAGHIMMNGEERHVYLLLHAAYDYEDSFIAAVEWDVIVPEGYDGICIGYYNTMLEQSEDYQNADTVLDCFDRDNMFFFRCD
ncbi:MAG: hypothetical protein IJL83_03625 [Clostridia bacterium]|nr:hypothetical protein [Clostridia bacterium]